MSFELLICLIPFSIAYLSFSIWLYERDNRTSKDSTLLIICIFSLLTGIGLGVYIL